jgi:hypothetical protein
MTLLARGVHCEPVLSLDGCPILVAVDHLHREVQRRPVLPGENPYTVSALLWEHLDLVDPEYSRRGPMRDRAAGVVALLCTSYALERALTLMGLG